MSGYLVVAHQTARSADLLRYLSRVVAQDAEAEFTLLIPATPPSHLLVWEDGEAGAIAERSAEEAGQLLSASGLRVVRSVVGNASPLEAIEEELRTHPEEHASVILCTLPPGVSRWLGMDVPHAIDEQFKVPVVQVSAGPALR